ncbi:MAG: Cof-type HAD-IIB family hydrolase [Oscillospiraceae bacterium]|jgi:Cof subfamily protein (haloacid dehalogenase superfamily)|nr:Cof-type HAD-IIB family hydrolase [Oscillospiraceae bacterium]
MNLNGVFLITDADGTILTDDKRILDADRAAVRELTESGGLFTIATGRGLTLARVVARALELEFPAVIFNGAAVYDFTRECFLWRHTLPEAAKDYVLRVRERFPEIGAEILRGDEVYVISTNSLEEGHLAFGAVEPIRCSFEEVPPDDWIKVLLVDEPEVIDEVIAFMDGNSFGETHLVRSSPIFYEMLAFGVDKGSGMMKLLELMGISGRYVVAAGDFMNDLEMLRAADLGVAVSNAEEAVKKEAGLVVCDNNSGAIRDIVEYLKKL